VIRYKITWEADGLMDSDKLIELALYFESRQVFCDPDILNQQWMSKPFKIIRVARVSGKAEMKRLCCRLF
jgi:hypothetical protein